MTTHVNIGEIDAIIQECLQGSVLDSPATRERFRELATTAIADRSPSRECDKAVAQTTVALEMDALQRIDSLATVLLARWDREP